MEKSLPPKQTVSQPVVPPVVTIREAYYMTPKNGGFQLRKVTIRNDYVIDDARVSDPDAWNQVMSELEHELSKKLQ